MVDNITKPRQERSRDTQRRLVQSTRELLEETVFEELTVAKIAKNAGSSVGTFYGRFKNKEAILPHILEKHYVEIESDLDSITLDHKWKEASLAKRVEVIIDFLVNTARREPGLIRMLLLRNLSHPETIPESIRISAVRILQGVYEFLLECHTEIKHPDPETALSVGLLMVTAAVRERLIMIRATQADTLKISEDLFVAELKRTLLLSLTTTDKHKR